MRFGLSLRTTHRDISDDPRHFRRRCISRCCCCSGPRSTPPAKTTWMCRSCPCSSRRAKDRAARKFTDAALPQPAPDPVEEVLDDPGTTEQTRRRHDQSPDAVPMLEKPPDRRRARARPQAYAAEVAPAETRCSPPRQNPAQRWPTSPSRRLTPAGTGAGNRAGHAAQERRSSSRRNCSTPTSTNTELTWQQDGQQYSARVHAPAGARQHGTRAGDRGNHDQEGRQAHARRACRSSASRSRISRSW